MARNQRGGNLDQSTRNHLSALDAYIAAEAEANKPQQPDEFTLVEFVQKMEAKGLSVPLNTAKDQLRRLCVSNKITKRLITIDGVKNNLYRFL